MSPLVSRRAHEALDNKELKPQGRRSRPSAWAGSSVMVGHIDNATASLGRQSRRNLRQEHPSSEYGNFKGWHW